MLTQVMSNPLPGFRVVLESLVKNTVSLVKNNTPYKDKGTPYNGIHSPKSPDMFQT